MERSRHILIAGAGIAGLTAALCFSRRGYAVRIFERAPALSEVGAGLQVPPNATRILDRIGVLHHLKAASVRPEELVLRRARDMKAVARLPLGDRAEARWGSHYLVSHRADLQSALLAAVRHDPEITLVTGASVTDHATHAMGVTASVTVDGRVEHVQGLMLIAADGVWSALRPQVEGAAPSRFSGHVAWRTTISAESEVSRALASILPLDRVTTFMAPAVHLVAYPVRGGRAINLVALMKGQDYGQVWEARPGSAAFLTAMEKAGPALGRLANEAGPWVAWALHAVGAGAWQDGRAVALIGDAAHATTPFAAQGAALAIEDAAALATAMDVAHGDPAKALPLWESVRKPRAAAVVKRGAFNHFVWHARGPIAFGRDLVLRFRPQESLIADFDWLYGYDAEAAVRGG